MPATRYKIVYFIGIGADSATKAESGTLTWQDDGLRVVGPNEVTIPFTSMVAVEILRLQGTGRMLKLTCTDRTIFMSVVWFSIGGNFACINYFKTGALFER